MDRPFTERQAVTHRRTLTARWGGLLAFATGIGCLCWYSDLWVEFVPRGVGVVLMGFLWPFNLLVLRSPTLFVGMLLLCAIPAGAGWFAVRRDVPDAGILWLLLAALIWSVGGYVVMFVASV
jgi:hypothetical protein